MAEHGRRRRLSFYREEVGDEVLDRLVGQIHVRVAQQRHEVVGVRAHAGVLEIDDVQPAVVEHQIAAVIVAMA